MFDGGNALVMGVLSELQDVLFPNAVGMVLDRLFEASGVVVAEAHSAVTELRCPDCATASRRVHSRYGRRLAECPVGGRRVVVKLEVRRFFCDASGCGRRTFVEQVDGLTTRYARAGPGVKTLWRSVALASGGRSGMRLCRWLAVPTGRAQLHAPEVPARSPWVLGVDDFAFRRSRTYGTILLDIETSTPIDLLPDRISETLAAWLTAHSGAEIICRDRDSGYSRAIKEAAPAATEVADRWHMLQNLSAAVEKTCHQHRACLHKFALDDVDAPTPTTAPPTALLPLTPPLDNIPATPLMQRVTERYAEIHRLREATWTISAIAQRFGLDRKTVRRYLTTDLDVLIASARDRRPRQIDTYRPYIQQRFTDGCTNATQIYRGDPRTRLPRKPPGRTPLRPKPAGRHRPDRGPETDPEAEKDHLMDHAAPRHADPRGTRPARRGAYRVPRHRHRLRPGPRLHRPGPRPPRAPPGRLGP
ncbi:ISL3 family transposase [Streptomyces sp. 7R007]